MPITPGNPFKGRHYSGEVIVLAVRWYLRYPLAYEHVAEMLAERGLAVDASCIWRGSKRMHRNSISAAGHIFGPPTSHIG
jgi:transposase-like protein